METACIECGNSLKLLRKGAKYCSQACKIRAYRRKKRQEQAIPEVMQSRDRWMRWKLVERNGRQTKVPLRLNGRYGSSTNPDAWCSYRDARNSEIGNGFGFALGDGIGCIDLDDCFVDGELAGWAKDQLDAVDDPLFIEVSQSGNGLHIFCWMDEKPGRVADGVETYSTGRFIAMTGNVYERV